MNNDDTKNWDDSYHSIVKIGSNTQQSLGDLRRFAVTQTPWNDHQITLVWKTHKEWNNTITTNNNSNNDDERKNLKRVSLENEKTTRNQAILQKSHQRINTWATSPNKILGTILEEDEGRELQQMDKRTRKLMTMNSALHPRDNIDRQYVSRKGRGELANIKDCVDTLIWQLEDYVKDSKKSKFQRPETTQTKQGPTEQQENKNWKKSNYMDISSAKQVKSHTRRPGHS